MAPAFLWAVPLLLALEPPVVKGRDLLLPVFGVSFAEPPYFEVRQRRSFAAATTTFFGGGVEPTFSTTSTDATSATITFSTTPTSQGALNVTNGTGSTTVSAADEQDGPSFPMLSTSIDAKITNSIAHVQVTQAYENTGEECLDTRYVVPLPHKAAISAMIMIIGDRVVRAEIREKERARQEFADAQNSGQSAGLLEQEEPGIFTMDIANILPGDVVQVVMEYVETLVPIDGVFAFTFPTVVGPRYAQDLSSTTTPAATDPNVTVDVSLEFMPKCLGVDSDLSLQVSNLNTSTQVRVSGAGSDIVIKFWFTVHDIDAQLVLASENGAADEGYFSLSIEPPQRRYLNSTQIVAREYVFILDMHLRDAAGIHLIQTMMNQILHQHLRPGDLLNIAVIRRRYVIDFATEDHAFHPGLSIAATEQNLAAAESWLESKSTSRGSGEHSVLGVALQWAFDLPKPAGASSPSRQIILMTSGHMSVDRGFYGGTFDMVRQHLHSATVSVIGLLPSMKYSVIESLAEVSHSPLFLARSEAEGMESLEKLKELLDAPVLTNLRLLSSSLVLSEPEPPHLPHVLASRPAQVVGKWSGSWSGARLEGRLADGSLWQFSLDWSAVVSNLASLRLQWARSRISMLSAYAFGVGRDTRAEVLQLGLEHSLVTEFTAFVAVDSDPVAPDVCGAATFSTTPQSTTTDRYGFGSDDDDDTTFAPESVNGCPVVGPASFCWWWLVLWLLHKVA